MAHIRSARPTEETGPSRREPAHRIVGLVTGGSSQAEEARRRAARRAGKLQPRPKTRNGVPARGRARQGEPPAPAAARRSRSHNARSGARVERRAPQPGPRHGGVRGQPAALRWI